MIGRPGRTEGFDSGQVASDHKNKFRVELQESPAKRDSRAWTGSLETRSQTADRAAPGAPPRQNKAIIMGIHWIDQRGGAMLRYVSGG